MSRNVSKIDYASGSSYSNSISKNWSFFGGVVVVVVPAAARSWEGHVKGEPAAFTHTPKHIHTMARRTYRRREAQLDWMADDSAATEGGGRRRSRSRRRRTRSHSHANAQDTPTHMQAYPVPVMQRCMQHATNFGYLTYRTKEDTEKNTET